MSNIQKDISDSPLYSEDLAPIAKQARTWSKWNLAAIWVGMAVCIPTYLLASYMIKSGLAWYEALLIIALANLIITIPMVLNGHAGVKYGIPFPVIGRAAFGTKGIHIASVSRGIIACGWFGIQTWIGGLALYAIFNAFTGATGELGLSIGKFIGFGIFWLINIYFIWKGTESIKWLETYSAPILIIMGLLLIWWGNSKANGFSIVLDQSRQLGRKTAVIKETNLGNFLYLDALKTKNGKPKVDEYKLTFPNGETDWRAYTQNPIPVESTNVQVQFKSHSGQLPILSSTVDAVMLDNGNKNSGSKLWGYILWLTAMVGFWATMAISIADITRYTATQKDQIFGQFIGLPSTMMLYSFVGIFVTCAAVINFNDVTIAEDAPWDPVTLLSKFENPAIVIVAQIFMLIATLSTNIAANVIAPSNAFSNLYPKRIDFRTGGIITGVIGILIAPWWLFNEISDVLIFVSGLLGPVLGILISDYFLIRQRKLKLVELYNPDGAYSYKGSGFNPKALIALFIGVAFSLVGYWIPELDFLYSLSWFTGFIISFTLYYLLMKKEAHVYID